MTILIDHNGLLKGCVVEGVNYCHKCYWADRDYKKCMCNGKEAHQALVKKLTEERKNDNLIL